MQNQGSSIMYNITNKLIFALLLASMATSCQKASPHSSEVYSTNPGRTNPSPEYNLPPQEKSMTDETTKKEKRDSTVGVTANNSRAVALPSATPLAPMVIAPREQPPEPTNRESYQNYTPNPWTDPAKDKLSTFAIDVDTASYTISRRKLNEGSLPPTSAVRVEEFVNYFAYHYPQPKSGPFAVHYEAAPSPFDAKRFLLKVGVQGRKVSAQDRAPVHLTLLVDVSGSMSSADKLPLVQEALKVMVNHLKKTDTVALTTYAGANRLVLPATGLEEKEKILQAIDDLRSGGGTAMASGMELAYEQAMKTYEKGAVNRVIVCSDGDANIGPVGYDQILKSIAGYVQKGITMTTLGVGNGNYQDTRMEQLANKGNGNYVYLDSREAALRFFSEQLDGTLQVIAKDVKIQVEFSDDAVAQYRLIGYENRDVADQSFRDDQVDAGEIGSGHSVTAIYELQLISKPKGPLATIRVRAKEPEGAAAKEWEFPFDSTLVKANFQEASGDFQFAAAVVGFAEILRKNPDATEWSLDRIQELAKKNLNNSKERQEFLQLVERASKLGAANFTPIAK
jgi:Ca-activated chloride channel homolog